MLILQTAARIAGKKVELENRYFLGFASITLVLLSVLIPSAPKEIGGTQVVSFGFPLAFVNQDIKSLVGRFEIPSASPEIFTIGLPTEIYLPNFILSVVIVFLCLEIIKTLLLRVRIKRTADKG